MSRPVIGLAELDVQVAVPLPRRETLSCQFACLNLTNVVGVNLAIAVNAATINSQANAIAMQWLASSRSTDPRRGGGCVALAHPPSPALPGTCTTRAPCTIQSTQSTQSEEPRATNPDIRDPAVHAPPDDRGWSVTPGVHLLGPVQGSGLRDVAFLVRRSDDQMVQLSELLYLVLVHLDGDRTSAEVAEDVSAAYGRTLTARGARPT